jgi:cobalt-zinc-cadmium efflux system membrane fusion protein
MRRLIFAEATLCFALSLLLCGCSEKGKADLAAEAPPAAKVEHEQDVNIIKVAHPEQFPLATAGEYDAAPELRVTGTVSPDVSRNIPVISLATGRVVDIRARLGDTVQKGQLLMKVQSSDISQAFSDYRQGVADESLAHAQLDRSKTLYEKGAIAQKDLQAAENAETKAQVTVQTALERIRLLGADADHPSSIIDITAPASGVITEQNVTAAAGVKTLDNSPNLFTIADLSQIWIICDVYENDLPFLRVGEYADIHVNAYPNTVLQGQIGNIGAILDPNIRTAKVRLEVQNPGILRFGMFVTAVFRGPKKEARAMVSASSVLHLHDRDWVYVPIEDGHFRRVEVVAGRMLPGNMQEILSGIRPGQAVVTNALVLQNSLEQ